MKELNQNAMHLITRENRNSKRYIHPNVHWSTIYNTQDTEATQMPINGGTDKEDVVHTHNEYYSAMKKRMKWCHLQKHEWIYKWSKAEKKISYGITYTWTLKNYTKEPIYKTDSQTQKTNLWLP